MEEKREATDIVNKVWINIIHSWRTSSLYQQLLYHSNCGSKQKNATTGIQISLQQRKHDKCNTASLIANLKRVIPTEKGTHASNDLDSLPLPMPCDFAIYSGLTWNPSKPGGAIGGGERGGGRRRRRKPWTGKTSKAVERREDALRPHLSVRVSRNSDF